MMLKLVKNKNKFRIFGGSKLNKCATNDAETDKTIRINLQDFQYKITITPAEKGVKLEKR